MNEQTKGYTMDTIEILRAARGRIANPKDWWAGPARGGGAHCALLALREVESNVGHPAYDLLAAACGVDEPADIPRFNDWHTHAEVLAAFDRAISYEVAKAEEFTLEPALA